MADSENLELEELQAFRPHWCLYWADRFAKSQFEIWRPYLRRSRYRYLVLVDGEGAVAKSVLAGSEDLPNVTFAHRNWPVGRLNSLPSLRGVLYVGNRSPNFATVNLLPRLAHVFVGHGHSEKSSSAARVLTLYDAIFVASYADLRRFTLRLRRRLRPLACAIGAPIVEGLEARTEPSGGRVPARPRVLYLPTWEGHGTGRRNYSSLEVVLASLRSRPPTRAELAVRPHPGTGSKQPRLRAALDEVRALVPAPDWAPRGKAAAMNRADVAVCDISGVASEFLFTRKPIVLPWGAHLEQLGLTRRRVRRKYPYAYLWDVTTESLDDAVSAALADEQLERRRRRFADVVFRGHRDLDEAARTFDTALSALRWRRLPVWLRVPFEAQLRVVAANRSR